MGLLLLTALKAYGSRVDVTLLDRLNEIYGRRYGRPIETAADDDLIEDEPPATNEDESEGAVAKAKAREAPRASSRGGLGGGLGGGGDDHGRGDVEDHSEDNEMAGPSLRQALRRPPAGGATSCSCQGERGIASSSPGQQRQGQRSSLGARAARVGPSREFTFD